MNASLTGTTALVTGSTSGIGRATAEALAALGAHVIVSGRNAARGESAAAEIRATGGKADFLAADLADSVSVRELAQKALRLGGGKVDVLVNNAGIFPFGATEEMTEEQFDAVYAVNVKAPFFLAGALAPAMADHGSGAIVNITTIAAENGMSGMSLYGSSKAALVLLTKAWSSEYGPRGVRVNAVSPGPILTEGTADSEEGLAQIAAGTPAGRIGTPQEIASAVAFLVAPQASFIHGAIVAVDGGRTAV
ncbi:SDR family NAD(P)-dependent oxidoreductase [Streptomyces sp. NPDC093228]|uniref:SDR family NAD(P)-dependent oxidoreductase n=1 Tax=Streptomyces sp. NPDC093228 TaxID=3155070 RepID=UPI00342935A3